MKRIIIASIFALLIAAAAHAAAPKLINYQGYLKESGVAATGTKSVTFTLYDAATGGAQLCTSGAQSVTVTNGLFSYKIGSAGCNLSAINWENPVYLEISVEGAVFSPREQVTGAAYSLGTAAPVSVYQTGATNEAGRFEINNPSSNAPALYATTNGTSPSGGPATAAAGSFILNNTSSYSPALNVESNGLLHALSAKHTGATQGGAFRAFVTGTGGNGGSFIINNAANTANVLNVNTNGTGKLILGNHMGASGNLLQLQSGGVDKFVVGKTGDVTATSFTGSGAGLTGVVASGAVAKAGDTMSGSLLISYGSSTDTFRVNSSGSGVAVHGVNTGGGVGVTGEGTTAVRGVNTGGSGFGVRGDSSGGASIGGFNTGTGNLFYGNHTGASGNLIHLQDNGVDKFMVGKTGAVTATSFTGDGSALTNLPAAGGAVSKTGDTMNGALEVSQGTATPSLYVGQSDPTDSAGFFENTNAAGAAPTVWAINAGTAATAYGVYGSSSGDGKGAVGKNTGTGYGLYSEMSGTGSLLGGDHTGASGNLIRLQSASVDKFTVTKAGDVTATSFTGSGAGLSGVVASGAVAKTGDTMSGALGLSQGGATATVYAYQTGTTNQAGTFQINNGSNSSDAIYAVTNGTGRAGYFQISNSSNNYYAVDGRTNGSSTAIYGLNSGSGAAGSFQISNVGSNNTAVYLGTDGTGALVSGNHTGGSGNLIKLQSGGVDKFTVTKTGDVTATSFTGNGSGLSNVVASGAVAKSGDTMSGGLTVNFNTATETLRVINTNATTGAAAYFSSGAATATVWAENTNGGASSYGIYGQSANSGIGVRGYSPNGYGVYTSAENGGAGIYAANGGTSGFAGLFETLNPANNKATIYASSGGGTATVYVENANVSGGYGLQGNSKGVGVGVYGTNDGGGVGVQGTNTSAGSTGRGVYGYNTGGGYGVYSFNDGTGTLYGGNHTGASGNLIKLQSGGVDKFTVDKNGFATATRFVGYNTGNYSAGQFEISNAASGYAAVTGSTNGTGPALSGYTSGTGNAGHFQILNGANAGNAVNGLTWGTGNAVSGSTSGTGRAGLFEIDNAGNASETLYVTTNGTGYAGRFTNGSGNNHVILSESSGTGITVYGSNTGNGTGIRGDARGSGDGVVGQNIGGTGRAGWFQIDNAANNSDAVYIEKAGGTGYFLKTSTPSGIDSTGNWVPPSSRKLKQDIRPISEKDRRGFLDMVKNTEVVHFRYKADPERERVGVIAEDAPEQIANAERTGLQEVDAIFTLYAAMQAQQAEIEALKAEIRELKEKE